MYTHLPTVHPPVAVSRWCTGERKENRGGEREERREEKREVGGCQCHTTGVLTGNVGKQ